MHRFLSTMVDANAVEMEQRISTFLADAGGVGRKKPGDDLLVAMSADA
jgi:hypothetical protein